MTYLVWRLHRVHAIFSVAVIVAVTALIVPTGIAIADSFHQAAAACSASQAGCGGIADIVFGHNGVFTALAQDLAMGFPLVLGILWGAPLVPGEFEAGTEDFAWTQGITRRRWVLANLGWAFAVAAVWGGALAVLFTWWRGPANALDGPVKLINFDVQGIAPVAYAVFAMALGMAAGALLRRVVPAIATTLATFLAVRIVTALYLRQQFAVSKNVSPVAGAPPLSYSLGADILPGRAATPGASHCQSTPCLAAHGYYQHITYLPASRFWPVQGAESGVFLILALALAIFTYWSVTTREA